MCAYICIGYNMHCNAGCFYWTWKSIWVSCQAVHSDADMLVLLHMHVSDIKKSWAHVRQPHIERVHSSLYTEQPFHASSWLWYIVPYTYIHVYELTEQVALIVIPWRPHAGHDIMMRRRHIYNHQVLLHLCVQRSTDLHTDIFDATKSATKSS